MDLNGFHFWTGIRLARNFAKRKLAFRKKAFMYSMCRIYINIHVISSCYCSFCSSSCFFLFVFVFLFFPFLLFFFSIPSFSSLFSFLFSSSSSSSTYFSSGYKIMSQRCAKSCGFALRWSSGIAVRQLYQLLKSQSEKIELGPLHFKWRGANMRERYRGLCLCRISLASENATLKSK